MFKVSTHYWPKIKVSNHWSSFELTLVEITKKSNDIQIMVNSLFDIAMKYLKMFLEFDKKRFLDEETRLSAFQNYF